MRASYLIPAMLAALFISGPARADSTPPARDLDPIIQQLLDPNNILRGQFTEEDVHEIFAVIRANLAGIPAQPSKRLQKKMEAFGRSLQARGALVGILLLDQMEEDMKQTVRELNEQSGAI
ncbi:MAG TPA: hypothetical protein VLV32_10805 [Burkholderiales bacterium]|nr:hypothetical protein [Burkholderiales bacterium]